MDCENFDEHLMDALYGELDELTAAAVRRHVDTCARCRSVWDGFESTRRAAVLPMEAPPADLTARILEAERREQRAAPWPRKLVRGIAWAGSHAMRPQLAMAALFMLVVGSSLLLLRGRGADLGAPIEVTERGEPAAKAAPVAVAEAEAPSEAAKRGGRAMDDKAEMAEAKSRSADGPAAPAAASPPEATKPEATAGNVERRRKLDDALALKAREGCAAAEGALRALASTDTGGAEARAAAKELAACATTASATAAPSSSAGGGKPAAGQPSAGAAGSTSP